MINQSMATKRIILNGVYLFIYLYFFLQIEIFSRRKTRPIESAMIENIKKNIKAPAFSSLFLGKQEKKSKIKKINDNQLYPCTYF